MSDPNADHSHQSIAGIIVHPSGLNVVLRDGSYTWIDVGMVYKCFGLIRQIDGPNWGDPDEWATRDTSTFMQGYPVAHYNSNADCQAVWGRVRKQQG